ncbi:class I SAM-dependent methyltransferase [Roseivivax isoporae]|uniref:ATP synthase subunit beta n=1 Tax=Roseivivax isoporae LMG 25204 TaxID=1449351 RepID=X7FBD7_9RHOB|nr:SAM-dependent methyltransferase [Roseivivax isoporae]ETX30090.1 ATP synthase subunit beta [Roseivivax isoporae LMG 25204]
MTALAAHLSRQIRASGPISVADYMAACLLHPDHGYYATRDPLGRAGDFVTAPEISQMFGELIGLCLAQAWRDQGSPGEIVLAELGPGRGTLMADALRAGARAPGFAEAARLHLVEASPALRAVQADTLAAAGPTWHDRVDTLPDGPLFLVANEFLDALPVRQFQRDGAGWRERVVGLDGDRLVPGLSGALPRPELAHRLQDTRDGDVVETCAPAAAVAAAIGARIARHGGAALFIDYGDWRSLGDTLQALAGHAYADPFAAPGAADLTAHVDFEPVAAAARPATHTRLTPQGVFLERLGITQRAQALARGLDGSALDAHVAAHRRLTHPDEMGTLFKVLGFVPEGAEPPPGLDA